MLQSQIYLHSRINAPAKRFGHILTNQGQSALIPFSSLELFFSPFWKSRQVRERLVSSQDRPLSRLLLRTFHMEPLHWRTRCFTHRTSLAVSHTSFLLQWHTLPTNLRTNILTGETKKNLFSLWLVYFCYYNKSFVVVFSKKFRYLFVLSINL